MKKPVKLACRKILSKSRDMAFLALFLLFSVSVFAQTTLVTESAPLTSSLSAINTSPAINNGDQATNVVFIVSKDTRAYTQVVDAIQNNLLLEKQDYSFKKILKTAVGSMETTFRAADVIVTLGAGAAEAVFNRKGSQPVIALLITDNMFSLLADEYFGSRSQALASGVSVVCLEQPVERSIKLAKLVMPAATNLGLMLGPSSSGRLSEIEGYVKASDMIPNLVSIKPSDNPILVIDPVINRSDVFIPLPDNRLINTATAKWILQLSYRYKVPVIAYSKTYLNAGALAAIYSSPDNVARQVSDLLMKNPMSSDYVGQVYQPAYFSVEFNDYVAENLNIRLRDEQFYLDKLSVD